jgi:hypothetical protein
LRRHSVYERKYPDHVTALYDRINREGGLKATSLKGVELTLTLPMRVAASGSKKNNVSRKLNFLVKMVHNF